MKNDFSLEIVIKNKKPISLIDLTNSLLSLNSQYLRFLEQHDISYDPTQKTLFIKELKSGSIIIELGTLVCYALPVLEQFNTLSEFLKHILDISDYFLGKKEEKPTGLTKKNISDLASFYDVTASDADSSINLHLKGDNNKINVHYNGLESAAIQNGARKELQKLENCGNTILTKQLLTFFQARFDDAKTGTRAIIENVTSKPLKVVFENKAIQQAMMNNHQGFSKPWQNLAYIVDVEIQTIGGVPKVYKILKFYEDEILDPD